MGIEIISNTVASYKDVPKDVTPKHTTETRSVVKIDYSHTAAQNISANETRAIQSGNNDGSGQGASAGYYTDEQAKEQQVRTAIKTANTKVRNSTTHCEFKYHEDTKRVSITVKDDETGEIVKEIPPEETLDMLSKVWEMAGLMVDEKR